MLNASQMETLSICRRNNLEEKNAFVFLASCGFRLRRQRTLRILLSTCQCFLGILQVPVTVWHSLLRSKKFGDVPKLKGKVHGTESQGSESCQSSQETRLLFFFPLSVRLSEVWYSANKTKHFLVSFSSKNFLNIDWNVSFNNHCRKWLQ